MDSGTAGESGENKRIRTEEQNKANGASGGTSVSNSSSTVPGNSGVPDLNFPLPGMKGTPCLIKVSSNRLCPVRHKMGIRILY